MSVLNQASDGLYTVLIVLVRALVRFGRRPREDLISICGGAVDLFDTGMLTKTINRWVELGLLIDNHSGVDVAEPYRSMLGKSANDAEARLAKVIRTVVFHPDNNERFWEAEKSKSADLSRGISWMLAQDVYKIDVNVNKLAMLEESQLLDSSKQSIGKNDTRWNGLKAWMYYLGFARDGGCWVVDPTTALRDVLPDIFNGNQELLAPDFVERAALILPVLDGGVFRKKVEATLEESTWPRLLVGRVSTSLSRAVQRLDSEGTIKLVNKSDAKGVVTLTGPASRDWRVVSHIGLTVVGAQR